MSPPNRTFSGAPWEAEVAYCRAIKYGNHIAVSGTAPVDETGGTHAPGAAYEQTKRCLHIINESLREHGASLKNVVRTRLFVTDISRWQDYARAHKEAFKDFPPATSMVEVKALIAPDMMVEIEAEAFLAEPVAK